MIKAITFDFWSTLYKSKTIDDTERLLNLKAAVEQGGQTIFDLEQFKEAVNTARETWTQTWLEQHRTLGADEWLDIILKKLHASLALEHLEEIHTGMENSVLTNLPTLVPEAEAVLAELSARYQLGLISDTGITPGRVLRQILKKDGIIGYFAHLTFSDEIGRSKPHPAPFLITLHGLGVSPIKAVHVGDLLHTDIAGAQTVGMRAVQYIGINQDNGPVVSLPPETTITPDAVIKNHAELLLLLKTWNESK